jgi:RNA recognition motif-containing protein
VNANRVYVGNLPYVITSDVLKTHMAQAGEVVSVEVFATESGRSKGCGLVEYSSSESARNAIETLNTKKIDGTERPLFIREDRVDGNERGRGRGRSGARGFYPRGPRVEGSALNRQVFVGNLPYNFKWYELKQIFGELGK